MITRIQLNNFGCFRGVSYDVAKTTIFWGPNEAGKTTIFDAIALEIAEKGKGKATGFLEEAKKRYGEKRQITIEMTHPMKIDYGKFANFFAIRSSKTEVSFGDDKGWEKEMRSRLLFGGYDLVELKKRFERLADTNQKDSYNRQLKEINSDLVETTKTLEELLKEGLGKYSSLVKELSVMEREIQKLEEKIMAKKQEKADFQKSLLEVKNQQKAWYYSMWKESYNRYMEIEDEIDRRYSALNAEELLGYEKRQEKIRQQEEDVWREKNDLDSSQRQWEIIRVKIEGIVQLRQKTQEKRAVQQKWALLWKIVGEGILGLSFVVVVVGLTTRIFPRYVWVIGGSILFLVGMVGLFLGFFAFREEDLSLIEDQKKLYHEALQIGMLAWPSSWENFVEMVENLFSQRKKKLIEWQQKQKELEREKQQLERDIRDFCDKHGIRSLADGEKLLERRRNLEEEKKGIYASLQNHIWREKNLSLKENNQRILEMMGDTVLKIEGSFQDLEQTEKNLLQRIENVDREIEEFRKQEEEIKKQLAKLQAWLTLQESRMQEYDRLARKKQELEEKKVFLTEELEATRKVLQILHSIEQEQASTFESLSFQVREEFGEVFWPFQEIEVQAFSSEGMILPDAGGEKRSLSFLSRGTQDLFYLALRLFLGKQMWDDTTIPGFFIFDEPFASLDRERMQLALQMLKRFQDKYDWQYIFLTKDEQLVKMFQKQWGEHDGSHFIVHELKRTG